MSQYLAQYPVQLFSNHSAVKREQIIVIVNIIRRRQGSGIGILFIASYNSICRVAQLIKAYNKRLL